MLSDSSDTGATALLAKFCHVLRYEDLSPEMIERVQYLLLDFLGIALRGASTCSSQMVRGVITDLASGRLATVIGGGGKNSAPYAALANGMAGHHLELDDVENISSVHPGVVIFPTTLAVAEQLRAHPAAFFPAVVAGYEVMIRLGRALNPAELYARGFHPTAICGIFGATAAAARLLGLSIDQIISALGIAGSMASGSMEFLSDGAWTKQLHPGWAAHSGILASMLARAGFVGPRRIVEGRFGCLHNYSLHPDLGEVTEGLGESYAIRKTAVKIHAGCRYNHAGIDSLLDMVRESNIRPEQIARIRCALPSTGYALVGDPIEHKRRPRTVVDAQFSFPFAAAVAVMHRSVTLAEFVPENIASPLIIDLMQRVECYPDRGLDIRYPHEWGAVVTLELVDGRQLARLTHAPKGDPLNPLSWEELLDKFLNLTIPVIGERQARAIVKRVKGLDEAQDLVSLMNLVASSEGF